MGFYKKLGSCSRKTGRVRKKPLPSEQLDMFGGIPFSTLEYDISGIPVVFDMISKRYVSKLEFLK